MTRALALLLSAVLLCAPATAQKLKVVATFSILGDMVERVAKEHADVTTLVGADADAHVFEPTPVHARAVDAARLVFANGLAFEPWIARLIKSTGSRARLVLAADRVKLMRAGDPHAWQNAAYAVTYVENIRNALIAADPANAAAYKANAAAYLAELAALDDEIRASFAGIPKARRRAITTHDAFGYLAAAYDVAFVAPLGISTEQQASAKGVARLIAQIKREKIKAVFVENISDPRLIEQIARETGVKIGGKLYSDALSTKAGPAPTYVAMMRHNANLLTAAMGKGL
jgi:zinc/manganese transport system substrate-binding protein